MYCTPSMCQEPCIKYIWSHFSSFQPYSIGGIADVPSPRSLSKQYNDVPLRSCDNTS